MQCVKYLKLHCVCMTRTLLAVVWKLNGEEGMVAVSEGMVLNEGERMNERKFSPKFD